MSRARVALIGGQFWPASETPAGLPTLARRLAALGIETQTFAHDARQAIHDWLAGYGGKIGLVGDSLGAGAAALYAGDQHRAVDFVGGFQPSAWDPVGQGPIRDRTVAVAANVLNAHCIWNPNFLETGGLGNAHYVITSRKTRLTTTVHHGAHPDDWGYSQDLMLADMQQVLRSEALDGHK